VEWVFYYVAGACMACAFCKLVTLCKTCLSFQ